MTHPTSPALLLGIDGGGTSTEAWLADCSGRVLGRGRSGPSNAKSIGPDAARRALNLAIASAFADAGREPAPADVACLGLAGFDRPADRAMLQEWSAAEGWARRLLIVNDGDLLLAAGTPEGWGVGVIAGTGSIAVGRAPDGKTARAGGWGYLFGDEGSAYAVALAALRWIARTSDGRTPSCPRPDVLIPRVCEALGAAGPSELVSAIYRREVDRARIAALAPIVTAAAEERSAAAGAILADAAEELAQAVLAVARQLGLLDSPRTATFPLVTAGGFLLATPALTTAIVCRLQLMGVAPSAVTPVPDPVFGALTLARRALDA
jgi:N-acetylglucosamine kinase-like BadF-type ATPase